MKMKRENGKIDREHFEGTLKRMGRCSAGAAEHNQEDQRIPTTIFFSKRSRRRAPTSSAQNRARGEQSLCLSISRSLSCLPPLSSHECASLCSAEHCTKRLEPVQNGLQQSKAVFAFTSFAGNQELNKTHTGTCQSFYLPIRTPCS